MSERTNKGGATSGQKVPKSPKSKFRAKSQQEQTAESKLRMEKRGEQLDKAKKKVAKQKPPKKSGPVKKAGRAAGATVHGYVHGKLYEVEHENVGTESAHRSELVGEAALRSTSRYVKKQIREHPAKAVQKAESRHIKATADYQYRATVEAHPEMQKGGAVSRYIQKQKIKRQYAKQAREAAKQTAKAAEKTAVTTEKLAARAVAFVKRHPVGVLLFLACFLLLVLMQSCMSSAVTIGNGVVGAIGASTYAAEDADLRGAEAAYCGLEAELQDYLDSYESTHDYDEYHFELDDIEHDPYVLLSIISAIHEGAWTVDEVQGTLQMLFEKAVHSDGNGGDGAPLLPRNGHMDGRRGQHPYRHIPGLLRLLHLHRDAGKLQPVPSAHLHYGRGSALPVRPVYVGAGQPSRPVSIVPLCGKVHRRSRGA